MVCVKKHEIVTNDWLCPIQVFLLFIQDKFHFIFLLSFLLFKFIPIICTKLWERKNKTFFQEHLENKYYLKYVYAIAAKEKKFIDIQKAYDLAALIQVVHSSSNRQHSEWDFCAVRAKLGFKLHVDERLIKWNYNSSDFRIVPQGSVPYNNKSSWKVWCSHM